MAKSHETPSKERQHVKLFQRTNQPNLSKTLNWKSNSSWLYKEHPSVEGYHERFGPGYERWDW